MELLPALPTPFRRTIRAVDFKAHLTKQREFFRDDTFWGTSLPTDLRIMTTSTA
jgi:hypothetical protein